MQTHNTLFVCEICETLAALLSFFVHVISNMYITCINQHILMKFEPLGLNLFPVYFFPFSGQGQGGARLGRVGGRVQRFAVNTRDRYILYALP